VNYSQYDGRDIDISPEQEEALKEVEKIREAGMQQDVKAMETPSEPTDRDWWGIYRKTLMKRLKEEMPDEEIRVAKLEYVEGEKKQAQEWK